MNRSPLARTLFASAALVAAIALAGCKTEGVDLSGRALAPIPDKTLAEMARKNMTKEGPILIRLFKQEAELEVWKEDSSGQYALLRTFPICRWSGELGPKIKEGDRQAPEGFYTVTPAQMNPMSQYYLAFNMGFPNAYDQAHGRTGAHLMVHGDCSSRGCYSMTDEQIVEIYALARESFFAGQTAFQIQAYPFRMTPANMAKHRNNPSMPFWKMLKEGYDHFEVTRLEPKVDVCERRYVFNATTPANSSTPISFNPRSQCPVYEVPEEIVAAVNEKKQRDEIQTAELINRGTPAAPVKMGTDGGMHEVFVAALQGGRPLKDKDGEIRGYVPVSAPGTIPPTVNPPSNVVLADASAATEAANVPLPRAAPRALNRTPTRTASVQPAAPPSRNFLGNLFTSNNSDTKSSSPSLLDRAARAVGLRGSSSTAEAAEAPAAPPKPALAAKPMPLIATAATQSKPRPAAGRTESPTRTANAGAIRPQPAAEHTGSAAPVVDAGAIRPQPQPAEQNERTAEVKTAASASLLAGAAPVIPTGSFGTSWSALR